MRTLLGIAGPAGVGKDTAANFLVEQYAFQRVGFADPIYAMLAAMGMPAPATREQKEAVDPVWGFSWRTAAQTLGTEWGRALDPDLWLKAAMRRCMSIDRAVISDVRFENEAEAIRKQGGTIIHMVGRASDLGDRSSHASEKLLQRHTLDEVVDNAGSIQELHTQLHNIMVRESYK
jgi:hypothetical protein